MGRSTFDCSQHPGLRKPEQPCSGGNGTERAPGAIHMHARTNAQAFAHSPRKLKASCQRRQGIAKCAPSCKCQGQCCGEGMEARTAMGAGKAFAGFIPARSNARYIGSA